MTKPKPTPRQTSDRVSRMAARLLKYLGERGASRVTAQWITADGWIASSRDVTSVVRSICASCINQDQVKGPRRRGRK